MFKKILALVLVIVLTATAAVGATVAYLTDRDSEANVFTVGDVSIDLNETFGDGILLPGKDIEKKPTITNTGKNDAWVWATIAIPAALDNDDASQNVVHFNYSKESVVAGLWNWQANGNWMIEEETIPTYGKDIEYNVYTVLYETPLKPDETTAEPVMTKVYMDPHVDIDPEGKVYHVEAGVVTDLEWNVNDYGNPVIYVSAYAAQKEGFDTCLAAYNAYQSQWADKGAEYANPGALVTTAAALNNALTAGESVVLTDDVTAALSNSAIYGTPVAVVQKNGGVIDGGGNSLDIENPVYEGYAIETYGGTVKNLTIDSTVGRGIVISSPKEDIHIDNVVIDGPGYAINTSEHNGKNLIVTNSTVNGWTSFAGLDSASWTNCIFGENTSKYWQNMGYDQDYDRLVKPYVDTTFTNCEFEQGVYIDLSALGADCTVTLNNCTSGSTTITADNYASYITIELPSGRTLAECVIFK